MIREFRFTANNQFHMRSSTGCARLRTKSTGFDEATANLFKQLVDDLQVASIRDDHDAFKEVDTESLVIAGSKAIDTDHSRPPENPGDANEVQQRIKATVDVTNGKHDHSILNEISALIETVFARQQHNALVCAKQNPGASEEIATQFEQIWLCAKFPILDENYANQLRHGQSGLQELSVIRNNDLLPSSVKDRIHREVQSESTRLIPLVNRQAAIRLARESYQQLITTKLDQVCQQIRQIGAETNDVLQDVASAIAKSEIKNDRKNNALVSTGIINIDGPDKEHVLENIHNLARTAGKTTLEYLKNDFRDHLLKLAKDVNPLAAVDGENTKITDLLRYMRTDLVHQCFASLIRSYVAEKLTVYQSIRGDLKKHAKQVLELASPMIELGGRDSPRLNVTVTRATTVRLPKPLNGEDSKVMDLFKARMSKLEPGCHFLVASTKDFEITITRTVAGFPASIMSHVADLKKMYIESSRNGHSPHLTMLGSDDGRGHLPSNP